MTKKKALSLIIAFTMLMAVFCFPAVAGAETNAIFYVKDGVLLDVEDHEITTVTGADLESAGVKTIAAEAFTGCDLLVSVEIPSGVTVEPYAFVFCKKIADVTIEDDAVVKGGAFAYCESLAGFEESKVGSAYSVNDGVLFSNNGTTLVQWPSGKEHDPEASGFDDYEYVIPEFVKKLEPFSFSGAYGLTGVKIPAATRTIGKGALSDTMYLHEITVDSGNQYFAASSNVLFNKAKTTLIQHPTLRYSKEGLATSYTIPGTVKTINGYAFKGAYLKKIKISSKVTSIKNYAFTETFSLESFKVSSSNEKYRAIKGVLYSKGKTVLVKYPMNKPGGNYMIPSTTKTIKVDGLVGNHLKVVQIPPSVKTIESNYAIDSKGERPAIVGSTSIAKKYAKACGFDYYSKPAKVSSPKATAYSGKKIKVSWKKVSGAKGYEIYRATSKNGTYKKIKTITKGTTKSYTNTKLKKGKKYYYKVRAYKTVRGYKVYGNFSSKVYKKAK